MGMYIQYTPHTQPYRTTLELSTDTRADQRQALTEKNAQTLSELEFISEFCVHLNKQ